MKIIFIAPVPPPVTGHSLAAKVFLDSLTDEHVVETVNLSKQSFKEGADSYSRFIEIANLLKQVYIKKKGADIIYLTISESFAGNLKDLFIYLICYRKLAKTYIHLHGGSIKKLLFDKYSVIKKINSFFIKRLGGVIVLGNSHLPIFNDLIDIKKIHIVPNFAQDDFFTNEETIKSKFENFQKINIIFLSNLITGKGYNEIAEAFSKLSQDKKNLFQIDFAGAFESEDQKSAFIDKIRNFKEINYHGVVSGERKKQLLNNAHVLMLPTSLFEGQPISILEAYVSGCAVAVTNIGGICDIFEDGINGFEIKEPTSNSIVDVMEYMLLNKKFIFEIAKNNSKVGKERYRIDVYNKSLRKIIFNQR